MVSVVNSCEMVECKIHYVSCNASKQSGSIQTEILKENFVFMRTISAWIGGHWLYRLKSI